MFTHPWSSQRSSRRVTPRLEVLEQRWVPASIFWAIDGDGLWNVATNWIDDQGRQRLPGFNDDVFLDRGTGPHTVTFAQNSYTVQSLWALETSLVLRGGTLGLRSSSALQSPFTLSGGRITLEGPLYLLGDTAWTGGTIDGDGQAENYATVTLSGSDAKFLRGSLHNYRTVVHAGTADLQITAFGDLLNPVGSLYDLRTDAGIVGEGAFTGQFNNRGWLRKSAGTGISSVPAVNNQDGLIEVQSGLVALGRAGKTHTGGYFWVHAGATLDLTSGAANDRFSGTYTGYGEGTVLLASGRFVLGRTGATLDFPWGMFQWTGGRIEAGSPGLTNVGVITLSGSNVRDLRGTLNNAGWFVHADSGPFILPAFATFNNQTTGIYYHSSDASILGEGAFNGRFNNAGWFLKWGGTDTTQAVTDFFNEGGTLQVASGTLALTRNLIQRSGRTLLSGALTVPLFDLQGGVLEGSGTITGNVRNAGTVEVGGLGIASYLLIQGNYQQTAAGTLALELGDHDLSNWDFLQVTGTATLSGRLAIRLLDDFYAEEGASFWIMSFSQRVGNFTSMDLPDPGSGFIFSAQLDGAKLTLLVNRR